MNGQNHRHEPVVSRLHPTVYFIIIGLCLWLIGSVWAFFGQGYIRLALIVVTLFIGVAVGIPVILWQISRRGERPTDSRAPRRFADWLSDDFETGRGRVTGKEAAMQILLPIAAVAFGMSAFALVLHLAV